MGKYQEVKNLVRSYFDELEKCAPEESEAVLKKYMSENYIWEGVWIKQRRTRWQKSFGSP